jgi:hypothetical protein
LNGHTGTRGANVDYLDVPIPREKAKFIDPMLLQSSESLPEGPCWTYELKFDGFRAIAIKTGGTVRLRSRNDKDFNRKYPGIERRSLPCRTRRWSTARELRSTTPGGLLSARSRTDRLGRLSSTTFST